MNSMSDLDYCVVVPTRGRRALLEMALESVYAQTVPPRQVIVVIDGDIDATESMLRERFPEVLVVVHQESLGPAASRDEGMRMASAEWVALLDDDDVWHSGKQESFHAYLKEHPDCEALRSAFWQFSAPGALTELNGFRSEIITSGGRRELEDLAEGATELNNFAYLDIEGQSLPLMLERNRGVTSTTMFRRDLLNDLPSVPGSLRTAEDWLLFVLIATRTEWHLVPGRWMFYRVHSRQSTQGLVGDHWRHRVRAWDFAWGYVGDKTPFSDNLHGAAYAQEVHTWVWSGLRGGQFFKVLALLREVRRHMTAGQWVMTMLPPPVRWRLRKMRAQ